MNDKFGVDPGACKDVGDLAALSLCFGPITGRYIADIPMDWGDEAIKLATFMSQLESGKYKTRIRRLLENKAILGIRPMPIYRSQYSWKENIARNPELQAKLTGIIDGSRHSTVLEEIFDLKLDPTAAGNYGTSPSTFVSLSDSLLQVAPRLYFVDPFLNITDPNHNCVVIALLQAAAASRMCDAVQFWVLRDKQTASDSKIKAVLGELKRDSGLSSAKFSISIVSDRKATKKVHRRYLFCQYGGIDFEYGFQRQADKRSMEVKPMSQTILNEFWEHYVLGANNFQGETLVA